MSVFTRYLLAVCCLLLPYTLTAQITKSNFGKNRLQFKEFNWRYYSTSNFDVYFYDDGQELAKLTAKYLEDEYDRITDLLGYAPYSKTKIFLYNSMADLQQSNVGVNENPFTVGGQTNFVKSQVEIAFPGTLQEFKEELILRVSHMLLMDMMFGGSLSDIFQNTYLMTLPEWFLEGAARYVAYGWGIEMDDYIRDQFKDGKAPKLKKLKGLEAALAGQSVWNFIAEEYGRSNISNILNYTRIIRNEEMAISNTLGMPFRQFINAWQRYYNLATTEVMADYSAPAESNMVTDRRSGMHLHNSVALSPDGRYLAFSENHKGRYDIKVKDLSSGKIKTVLETGYRVLDQQTDDTIPLVDWQDSTHLGVMSVRKGLYTLYLVNVLNKKSERQTIRKVSQVNNFSFSPNGRVLVMSAEKEGKNDIYLYSLKRQSLTAITNDGFDDITPAFVPGTNNIVFSSNRTTDSLNYRESVGLSKITDNYNIYIFNIDTTGSVLTKITNTVGKSQMPVADGKGTIYFLNEQRGINNLFRYNVYDSLYQQLTSYYTGIQDYSLNPSTGALAFISLYDGSERVFYYPSFDLNQNKFTKPTKRQGILQTRQLYQNRLKKASVLKSDSLQKTKKPALSDSLKKTDVVAADTVEQALTEPQEPGLINTDNYVFDPADNQQAAASDEQASKPSQAQERRTASFLSSYRQSRRKEPMKGPYRMDPRFMVNNLVTSVAFDPLRASLGGGSLGFIIEGELSDLLENHKIYGGVLAMADLRSGDLYLEYQYLKNLIDFRMRLDRRVVIAPLPSSIELDKFVLNKAHASFSYPLSISTRIEAGPTIAGTRYLPVLDPATTTGPTSPLVAAEESTLYTGGQMQFVVDNTQIKGFNILQGTRGKLQYEHLLGVGQPEMGFGKITAELRHYQPISREITLAVRGFYGRFTGANKPLFVLGGMDNWVFNSTNRTESTKDPFYQPQNANEARHKDNRNVLFYEYVTPLRGFEYSAQNGSNVLALNLELRVPLVQYFYRGPISSNFFRNLQFTGFFDIGSSWSGKAPFYKENSVNTSEPEDSKKGGFDIVLVDYKNPWLSGYGFGVRTVLLGYYAKFDVGYPVVDYQVRDPKFYLTLGFDF